MWYFSFIIDISYLWKHLLRKYYSFHLNKISQTRWQDCTNILVQYHLWLNYTQWIFKTAISINIYYQYRLIIDTCPTNSMNWQLVQTQSPSFMTFPQILSVASASWNLCTEGEVPGLGQRDGPPQRPVSERQPHAQIPAQRG